MGLAIDTNAFAVTATGIANFVAATPFTGDVANVRMFNSPDTAYLLNVGAFGAAVGIVDVKSPLMHDDVWAIRTNFQASNATPLLPFSQSNQVFSQDTLNYSLAGTSADVYTIWSSIFYSNLPGAAARLHMPGDINALIQAIMVQEVDFTAAGASGAWASSLLPTVYNVTKANRDYALLGFTTSAAFGALAVMGSDTGNLKVGSGGTANAYETRNRFVDMCGESGYPCIPVINAANWPATNCLVANNAATTADISLIFALLTQNLSS